LDPNDLSAMSGKHSPDFSKNSFQMRMGLIVVSLSALTAVELGTPSPTKTNAPDPIDQLTVNVSVASDTLEAADRIEIHHLQDEASPQPASPVEPAAMPASGQATAAVTSLGKLSVSRK
jgi:hypothetical protein